MQPPWGPAVAPYVPPRPMDGRIVAGAALTFTGFLLQGLGWFMWVFIGPWGPSALAFLFLGVGAILTAVGFLVAFLGLARPRA